MAGRGLTVASSAALFVPAEGARVFWRGGAESRATVSLFGLAIDNRTVDAAVSDILSAVRARRKTSIVFVNAHVVNTMAADRAYRDTVARADVRLADGSGMAIAAQLAGTPLVGNPNGTDVFPRLAAQAAEAGVTIFLVGGAEGVADAAAATVRNAGYGAAIAGTHHGYFAHGSAEEDAVIAAINASGADIVLVGLGVPQQDRFVERNRHRLQAPVLAGVGGLFDYFSGRVSRAPVALRGAGLEWLWRLALEPRRLWRRYLLGNVVFLARAVTAARRR
jgi:exopolysaccharide biosynthesis WecB/TagA/CpsF family protein